MSWTITPYVLNRNGSTPNLAGEWYFVVSS